MIVLPELVASILSLLPGLSNVTLTLLLLYKFTKVTFKTVCKTVSEIADAFRAACITLLKVDVEVSIHCMNIGFEIDAGEHSIARKGTLPMQVTIC